MPFFAVVVNAVEGARGRAERRARGLLEDRRRIQTVVLGDAASEVPLLLPLEAIEVDAFRREQAGDTHLLVRAAAARLWRAVDDEAVHRHSLND